MKRINCLIVLFLLILSKNSLIFAKQNKNDAFQVKGFSISAPKVKSLNAFIKFIEEELVSRGVNTLLLRVDYNYQFESHPELRDQNALSKTDVKQIVKVCKSNNINIVPQINLLGHQSWANTTHNLLRVYPQFDETPHVKMPEIYEWPNEDGLYCKSYCPLHPEVHKIVFDLVDEICEVFEATAFHAGMDEVFYLGDEKCPRCSGMDKATLFAGEVKKVRQHLKNKGRELWIWGDRLLDGETTGIGMWEASMNNTHPAIDMIPKDVVICDWHYERPDQTAVYFAMKGFQVITCTWNKPEIALAQAEDVLRFRESSSEQMKSRFLGVMQTVWSGTDSFLEGFYGKKIGQEESNQTPWLTFKSLYEKIESFNNRADLANTDN